VCSDVSEVRRRSLRSASINLFFIYTTRLAQTVATAAADLPLGIASSPLLPAINILLQWAATNPLALRHTPPPPPTPPHHCAGLPLPPPPL